MPIFRLSEKISFPPPYFAEPEGLLAIGGDLSEKRILLAYQMGIFPWFGEDEPIFVVVPGSPAAPLSGGYICFTTVKADDPAAAICH
ncbi:MAG: hypothetical protein R2875_04795 [Desulfobacterales bacterium]